MSPKPGHKGVAWEVNMSSEALVLPGAVVDTEAQLYRKATWRLIPLLFACYVAAYLDRVNVGFAKLQMLGDLHFSETVYGLGAGIFFIGCFPFEVPSEINGRLLRPRGKARGRWHNVILHKVGARVWIARVMVSWALVSAAAAAGMVVCGRMSDAARERRWHIVVPGMLGTAGWLVSVWFAKDAAVAEIALTVATTGVLLTLAQFWCLPTSVLAGAAAASGMAVINSVGNLAGFVSPYGVGWIIDATHSTTLGIRTLAACLLAGSLLALTMPERLVNR